MKESELKRCPFCGGHGGVNGFPTHARYDALKGEGPLDKVDAGIFCQCGAQLIVWHGDPWDYDKSMAESCKRDAIAAWNRRAGEGEGK